MTKWWNGLVCIIKLYRVAIESENTLIVLKCYINKPFIVCLCSQALWPPVYLNISNAY